MDSVARICKKLIIEQPFYGLFLCGVNKIFKNVGSACIGIEGINIILYIDQEYWKKSNDTEKRFILMHELGHSMLYHIYEMDYWHSKCQDHSLLNIAMDCAVNTLIDEKLWKQDSIACQLLTQFKNIILPYKGTLYYIEFLKSLKNRQPNDIPNPEPSIQSALIKYDNMSSSTKQKIQEMLKSGEDLHSQMNKISNNLSDNDKELGKSQLEYQLKETAKNTNKWPGSVGGDFYSFLEQILTPKPPVYNWKAEFRRILATAFDIYRKQTRRKESKRFEEAFGSKRKKKHNILIGIDTSGSISTEDFEDFFSEIKHIYDAGCNIHIIECDTRIVAEYDYKGKLPTQIHGRGGTILKPIYDYWNKSKDYTLLVLFTDGYCDSPDKLKGHSISIITSGGRKIENFPGKQIFIKQ